MQIGQFNGVLNNLDLRLEASDVVVGDVRYLFEDQLLDLGSSKLLKHNACLCIQPHEVASAHVLVVDRCTSGDHPLLVAADEDDQTIIAKELLDRCGNDLSQDVESPCGGGSE